jgi:hypothetical protein
MCGNWRWRDSLLINPVHSPAPMQMLVTTISRQMTCSLTAFRDRWLAVWPHFETDDLQFDHKVCKAVRHQVSVVSVFRLGRRNNLYQHKKLLSRRRLIKIRGGRSSKEIWSQGYANRHIAVAYLLPIIPLPIRDIQNQHSDTSHHFGLQRSLNLGAQGKEINNSLYLSGCTLENTLKSPWQKSRPSGLWTLLPLPIDNLIVRKGIPHLFYSNSFSAGLVFHFSFLLKSNERFALSVSFERSFHDWITWYACSECGLR